MKREEQYRKMAEAAGWPVYTYEEWYEADSYPPVYIVLSPHFKRIGGSNGNTHDWEPELDLNRLAEWLEAVGVKRGWASTASFWNPANPQGPFYFAATKDGAPDCRAYGPTFFDAAINAVTGGADDAG
jgi:hypothetical protein